MTRLTSIAIATVLLMSAPAFAQQAELAAKLNDEGKDLMYDGKFAEASAKFRDAVARVPEPKYFFNLCTSLYQEGKFSDAMTACGGVGKNSPSPELDAKAKKMMDRIETEAKAQNITLVATGGGGGDPNDPNNPPPDPNNPPNPNNPPPNPNQGPVYQQAYGRPPAQNLYKGTTSDNKYVWTLGLDLFAGGGSIGQMDYYGNTNQGIRIKGDYLLRPEQRIGAQGYFSYTHYQEGDDQAFAFDLDIMDLGIAIFKDFCVAERLCLRPLAGVSLAFMSPANETDIATGDQLFNYTALGFRLELGAFYAFGTRMEHVLGVSVGGHGYSAVFSESPSDPSYTSEYVGLDKGGGAGYFAVGYTYRFNTPLGSSPFVTLE
ncbi:MAG: hypothetical protein AB7T06_42680 [Kofleriaceae bacterium]